MKELIDQMVRAMNEAGQGKQKAEVAYAVTAAACFMVSKLALPGKDVEALVAGATLFLDYANKLQEGRDALAGMPNEPKIAPGRLN